jgi:hypothetical protein
MHHIKVGHHTVLVSKKYYKDANLAFTAPILSQKNVPGVKLTATGHQVKITVRNIINKQAIEGAEISAAGVTAKTAQDGTALLVLPAGTTSEKAKLSHDGYNDANADIKVSGDKIQENSFTLTPSGKVYFLSKLSGKIDVVKTNLDGTDRQTVLAGTGKEDDRNTVLLASRDWKYLALLSRRAGSNPSIYLINTSDDSLTTIDSGTTDFGLVGWLDNDFVYTVTHSDVQLWQNGRQVIKSYNAPNKKLSTLEQTTASGTNNFDFVSELIGDVYAFNGQVFYIKNWTASFNNPVAINNKQATFNSIKPDGSAKKAIRSFGLADGTQAIEVSLESKIENPNTIDLKFSDGTKDNFYAYASGQVKDDPGGSSDGFYTSQYPTYLLSPSADQTFWSESRDGKNTLFIGDQGGQNGKQIASLSDYNTFGWFTDDYLLVSKNSSELYIMDKAGKQAALKVSDYHKPTQNFYGYGGGYGGL